jgi:hypothetical protein
LRYRATEPGAVLQADAKPQAGAGGEILTQEYIPSALRIEHDALRDRVSPDADSSLHLLHGRASFM